MSRIIVAFLGIGIVFGAIIGWVMNIIAIVHSVNGEVNALFIARCIGVFFAPLGVVLGWFA